MSSYSPKISLGRGGRAASPLTGGVFPDLSLKPPLVPPEQFPRSECNEAVANMLSTRKSGVSDVLRGCNEETADVANIELVTISLLFVCCISLYICMFIFFLFLLPQVGE